MNKALDMNTNKPLFMQSSSETGDNSDYSEQAPATAPAAASDAMSNTQNTSPSPSPYEVKRAVLEVAAQITVHKAEVSASETLRGLIGSDPYRELVEQRGEKNNRCCKNNNRSSSG